MYAQYHYACPRSLSAALRLLTSDPLATPYCGGTDVLVKLRSGRIKASMLVDMKGLVELGGITESADTLSIGATCSFSQISRSPLIRRWAGSLADAADAVGSVQIRNQASLAGNICTASPAGDGLTAAWGLSADLLLRGPYGERLLPLSDFISGPGRTALLPGEIISRILIAKQQWDAQFFFKNGRRKALAISVVNGVVALAFDGRGRVERCRVAIGSCGPTPLRISRAEAALTGRQINENLADEVAHIVAAEVRPISDLRAGADYRAYLAGQQVKRHLLRCKKESCQ